MAKQKREMKNIFLGVMVVSITLNVDGRDLMNDEFSGSSVC